MYIPAARRPSPRAIRSHASFGSAPLPFRQKCLFVSRLTRAAGVVGDSVDDCHEFGLVAALRPDRAHPPIVERPPRARPRLGRAVPLVEPAFLQRRRHVSPRHEAAVHPTRGVLGEADGLAKKPPPKAVVARASLAALPECRLAIRVRSRAAPPVEARSIRQLVTTRAGTEPSFLVRCITDAVVSRAGRDRRRCDETRGGDRDESEEMSASPPKTRVPR